MTFRVFTLMTVQHTGTRSMYKLFERNRIQPIKLNITHYDQYKDWWRFRKGNDDVVAFGHPLSHQIAHYDLIKDAAINVTMERPYKDIKKSWEERYSGKKYEPNSFGVGLEEQYAYWLDHVKPMSLVVDLYSPEEGIKKLGLNKGNFEHVGKLGEEMVVTVEIQRTKWEQKKGEWDDFHSTNASYSKANS